MSNVKQLPVWKKNCTPVECLLQLAKIAEESPDKFSKMIIIHMGDGEVDFDWHTNGGISVAYGVGLLEMAKFDIINKAYQ